MEWLSITESEFSHLQNVWVFVYQDGIYHYFKINSVQCLIFAYQSVQQL